MTPELWELYRGFLDHAEVHFDRGNLDAVREAHADARRLLGQHDIHDEQEIAW